MKAQEIFDTVATHLFRQGHQAIAIAIAACLYRAPNGDMCAVGVLIPDEYYKKDFEMLPVGAICSQFPEWLAVHILLLKALQRVHDSKWNWKTEERLRIALRIVAKNHDLDDSIVDGLSFQKTVPVVEGEEENGGRLNPPSLVFGSVKSDLLVIPLFREREMGEKADRPIFLLTGPRNPSILSTDSWEKPGL